MSGWRWLESAHDTTLAVLVGAVVVDPTSGLRGADWSGWLTGQQRVDRVMSRLAPPPFLAGTAAAAAAALVSVSQSQARVATGRALAAGCLGAAIAVTLVVNEPVNTRLRAWRPQDEPPADWRADRARWDRGHAGRRALVAAAAAASLWGRSGAAAGRLSRRCPWS